MGRQKSTSIIEQRILRLRYDKAAKEQGDLLIKKRTNWTISSPRDGISDLIAKELEKPEPPLYYNNRIPAKTNAIWRIGVGDRANHSSAALREQREEDIREVRQWMRDNVDDKELINDMVMLLGLENEERFENGPLGGSRPPQVRDDADVSKRRKTVRRMLTTCDTSTDRD